MNPFAAYYYAGTDRGGAGWRDTERWLV